MRLDWSSRYVTGAAIGLVMLAVFLALERLGWLPQPLERMPMWSERVKAERKAGR